MIRTTNANRMRKSKLYHIGGSLLLLLLEYTRQHSHKRKQKIIFAIEYLSIVCATHNLWTHFCVYILLYQLSSNNGKEQKAQTGVRKRKRQINETKYGWNRLNLNLNGIAIVLSPATPGFPWTIYPFFSFWSVYLQNGCITCDDDFWYEIRCMFMWMECI